jgi:MYXO-CTERM domain-containing protein
VDQGVVPSDAGIADSSTSGDRSGARNGVLFGGCAVPGAGHPQVPAALLVVVVLLIVRRRR